MMMITDLRKVSDVDKALFNPGDSLPEDISDIVTKPLFRAEMYENSANWLTEENWIEGLLFEVKNGKEKACAVGSMYHALSVMLKGVDTDSRSDFVKAVQRTATVYLHALRDKITEREVCEALFDKSVDIVSFNDTFAKDVGQVKQVMLEVARRIRVVNNLPPRPTQEALDLTPGAPLTEADYDTDASDTAVLNIAAMPQSPKRSPHGQRKGNRKPDGWRTRDFSNPPAKPIKRWIAARYRYFAAKLDAGTHIDALGLCAHSMSTVRRIDLEREVFSGLGMYYGFDELGGKETAKRLRRIASMLEHGR